MIKNKKVQLKRSKRIVMTTTTVTLDGVKTIKTLNEIAETGLSVFNHEEYNLDDEATNPDGIVVRSHPMHDMKFGENLKAIARAGAGVNNIPVKESAENGIVVFNTPGANANAVKEIVLTSLMASSRNLFQGIDWVNSLKGNGDQVPDLVEKGKKQFVGREVKGKKLGVIGLGSIGALVANDALDLDMDVIGYDPYISVNTAWELSRNIERAMSLEEVIENADYITLHVPLTEETRGVLNAEAFERMKDGVHIFNFSRGGLVDEDDLEKALESGRIGKYITDFPTDRILKLENTVALPHLGASTKESEENCARMATRQLKDFLETGNITNAVNFPNALLPYTGKRRITVFHHNVPNMVGQISSIISKRDLNIAAMINKSREGFAYTMIDIDEKVNGEVLPGIEAEINEIEDIIRVRII